MRTEGKWFGPILNLSGKAARRSIDISEADPERKPRSNRPLHPRPDRRSARLNVIAARSSCVQRLVNPSLDVFPELVCPQVVTARGQDLDLGFEADHGHRVP